MSKIIVITFLLLCSSAFGDDLSEQIFQLESLKKGENAALSKGYLDAGKTLYKKRLYEKAAVKFRKAIQLNPSEKEAEKYLILVQAALGSRKSAVLHEIENLHARSTVFDQERLVELDYLIEKSEHQFRVAVLLKDDGDINKYLEELFGSQNLYIKSRDMALSMNNTEKVSRSKSKIKKRLNAIDKMILKAQAVKDALNRKEVKSIMVRQMAENKEYLEKRIGNMMRVASEYMEKEEYENAIQMTEEILIIEPSHEMAKKMRLESEKFRHEKARSDTKKLKSKEVKRRYLEIKETFIPYAANVVYPDDWKDIKLREKQVLKKQDIPEWKQRINRQLEQRLNFKAPPLPLVDVLSQLADLTKMNIVLSSKVAEEKDEDELELQALRFDGLKLKYILNWIVEEVGLSYGLHMDVIYVTLPEGIKDDLLIEIIDVQDLLSERQNFKGSPLKVGAIQSADGGAVEFSEEEEAEAEKINSDILIDMVKKSIPDGDWDNEEAGVILEFLQSGALFVKNTGYVQNKLVDLLKQLRQTNSIQIEVQARLLSVEKNFFRDIGVDWKGLDINKPLRTGESQGFAYANTSGSLAGSLINNIAGEASNLGFFLEHSILSSFQAKVVFRAIEEDRTVSQLSSPRLVLLNNASSYIQLVKRIGYIQSYSAADGGDGSIGGVTPNIVEIDDAQALSVKATVSSDRKYITLRAKPAFNTVTLGRTATFIGRSNVGGIATSQEFSYPIDLPVIEIKEIKTTAIIPDGGILILGGVSESHENDQERGVPILSKIPGIGRLFRSSHSDDSSKDSMFLIHGKIIIFSEEEESL